jgi:hypothetical protein
MASWTIQQGHEGGTTYAWLAFSSSGLGLVVSHRWKVLLIGGAVVATLVPLALRVRFPTRDPTEGGVTVLITNDRQTTLYVAPCEDNHCRHLVVGGRLLTPGASIAPMVQPFTDVPFAVKEEGSSASACLMLVLDKVIDKSYGLSALTPCPP